MQLLEQYLYMTFVTQFGRRKSQTIIINTVNTIGRPQKTIMH